MESDDYELLKDKYNLHLSENMPSVTEGFFNFLNNAAQELSHLYILGYLFEAWIGDDDNSELATNVMQNINHSTRNGLEVFFIQLICFQIGPKPSAPLTLFIT